MKGRAALAAVFALAATAGPAGAASPILERPSLFSNPSFVGAPATPRPLSLADAPRPPRHPFMAPNDASNIHDDGYQSDTAERSGPLGRSIRRVSTGYEAECASVTFDARGRIVTICVGLDRPRLKLLDPNTLDELASYDLPPRQSGLAGAFTDFSGGGYFYLDNQDRAVVPTADRHLLAIGQRDGRFVVDRDTDLSGIVPAGDKLIAAMPDWKGRIWVVSTGGVVATIDRTTGAVRSTALRSPISNSFAVDDTGGVFVVADNGVYRFDAAADGTPRITWRQPYANDGQKKSGQTQAGSGTTPTVMGRHYVAITDNADPVNVVVYKRDRRVKGSRRVCTQPVFDRGASSTDNSLIGTARSMVVENNSGYSGITATQGGSVAGGLARVDVNPSGRGCRLVWRSAERAPSVVAKMSLANGLVYTYTKDPDTRVPADDPWYLTTLDFRTGRTAYKQLAGLGLGYNNNYAPVTIGPTGTAYVGTLGGLVALRDATEPPKVKRPVGPRPRLKLAVRCVRRAFRARVVGSDSDLVTRAGFALRGRRLKRKHVDRTSPLTFRLRRGALRPGRRYRLSVAARLYDSRSRVVVRRVRGCRR